MSEKMAHTNSSLHVEISSLKLENPTMLAAGVLGVSGLAMNRVANAGAGAIITKSMGLEPRRGFPNPVVAQVQGGILNAMGLPNPGIRQLAEEIQKIERKTVPIIVSIYASTPEDFAAVACEAVKSGAAGVELNVSCPHAETGGAEIGQNPDLVEQVVKATVRNVNKPVFVKLTPEVTNISEVAKAAENAGAEAITAINTVKAMVIDVETAQPILGNKIGGLSGPAIKPIAVRCVYEIYEAVRIPIIGCGGIVTWKDAIEMMEAGASAIQVGTAIAIEGLGVFKRIAQGIQAFMEKKGFDGVKEIVGLSHKE